MYALKPIPGRRPMRRLQLLAVFGVLVAAAACERSDDEGLVAWWKFDETGGILAADASGNGNRASVHGGVWGEGRIGGALSMDGGNNSIVVVPLSDSLRSTAARVTVMAWTYRTAQHNVDVVGHGYPGFFFGFHGPQFKWQIVNGRGEYADCYADPKYRAGLDRWIHVAATYDGATARLYADGEPVCERPLTGPIVMPELPFTLSGYFSKSGSIVDEISGRLDEVRIYNRALAAREIRAIYRSGN